MKPERPAQATERIPKIAEGRPDVGSVRGRTGRRQAAATHGPLDREAAMEHARKLEALRRRGT